MLRLFLLLVVAGSPLVAQEPPNLLVIMTDEHNFRTIGAYRDLLPKDQALMWGESVVETPFIDSIGKEGVVCTSFYATTPVCSPSRAAFVSGLYPQNTPVNTNNIKLDDSVVTFAEVLRKKGYHTGYAGKWHLDGDGKPQWAPERKFGFDDNRFMFNRGHWKKLVMEAGIPKIGATKNGKPTYSVDGADEETFATDFLCNRTIDFIKANADKRFCYMLSLPDPHGPDTVREPYDTMYANQTYTQPVSAKKSNDGLPGWLQTDGKQSNYNQSRYYGMVKCIDDNIGRILKQLKDSDVLDKTIIVFTSDHGDLRGEHGRQNKGVPMEASSRIAFLVRYPPRIKGGTVVNEALGTVDFKPTILGLLGVENSDKVEGRDASQLLTEGKRPAGWRDVTFVRSTGTASGWLAAFTDRYKFVVSTYDTPWLLDLKKDPNESTNYAMNPEYREVVKDLGAQLLEYGQASRDVRASEARIQADLKWAVSGSTAYTGPERKAAANPGKKAKKDKKKTAK
jgi:arylsulfatase A-like enzyme